MSVSGRGKGASTWDSGEAKDLLARPPSFVETLRTRWALGHLDEVGPGARVRGRIWAPAWRGVIRAGRNLRIHAEDEPVELHALWGGEIRLGDDVEISGGVSVEAQAVVSIGHGVRLGARCKVMDNDFHVTNRYPRRPPSQPVVIGDGAQIGAGAILLPGAHVAAGTVIPPGAVVHGSARDRLERIPIPPPASGLRGLLYRAFDRGFDLLSLARAVLVLRGCQHGIRVRAGNVNMVGRERIQIGDRAHFARGMLPTRIVTHATGRITIGDAAGFNYGSRIEAWCSIEIGSGCRLGSRVEIDDRGPDGAQPIVIGNNVWIAHGARIGPGVRVGTGSVIAAGTVVTRDVPPESLAIGNPARNLSLRLFPAT